LPIDDDKHEYMDTWPGFRPEAHLHHRCPPTCRARGAESTNPTCAKIKVAVPVDGRAVTESPTTPTSRWNPATVLRPSWRWKTTRAARRRKAKLSSTSRAR
jgi:hypothetical protein